MSKHPLARPLTQKQCHQYQQWGLDQHNHFDSWRHPDLEAQINFLKGILKKKYEDTIRNGSAIGIGLDICISPDGKDKCNAHIQGSLTDHDYESPEHLNEAPQQAVFELTSHIMEEVK